jgi:uncharacterized protein (TIGR01777 family)
VKVVLAGGSGLIGRALCDALVDAGHEPVVLTRHRRRPRQLLAGVRSVPWAPPVLDDWAAELGDAGAVINLAGESIGRWPWTRGRKRALLESRLQATGALVEAVGRLPVGRRPAVLLSASGTDVYEDRDAKPADESTPPADTFLSRLCLTWEAEALRAEALGLRVVLMRTSPVMAPGAPVLRVLSLPFRLFAGGRLGSGRHWMSWVDIGDAVGLYLWALESNGIHGPLNVTAPDPRRQSDFGRVLAAALHRPSWFPTPAWVVRLALGDQATLALGSRRVWPARALASGYAFRRPRLEDSLTRALA